MKVVIAVLLLIHSAASQVCKVSGSSKGFNDVGCSAPEREECAILTLCGVTYRPFAQSFVTGIKRGIAVMQFDPFTCTVTGGETFDLWGDQSRVQPFNDYVNGTPDDTTLILATADDYTKFLNPDFSLLQTLGSPQAGVHAHRSSLTIFVRRVNGIWCQIGADYKASGQGPASVEVSLVEMGGINC